MLRLWFIEGIPGAGKSTLSWRLTAAARAQGLRARWWVEEDKHHPILPAELRRRSGERSYANICLEAFRDFVDREEGTVILDGAAFQSTIRFMFANDMPAHEIRSYLTDWSSIVAPMSKLIVLKIADPVHHYSCFVQACRGAEWIEKVGAYTANTPIARRMGWTGLDGLARFWAAYQTTCTDLLPSLSFPVRQIVGWPEGFAVNEREVLTFMVG